MKLLNSAFVKVAASSTIAIAIAIVFAISITTIQNIRTNPDHPNSNPTSTGFRNEHPSIKQFLLNQGNELQTQVAHTRPQYSHDVETYKAKVKVKVNITVYHINPISYSPEPINMNLGDTPGDAFFDISQILFAFACSDDGPPPFGVICDNAEYRGADISVTKLVLEVSAPNTIANATNSDDDDDDDNDNDNDNDDDDDNDDDSLYGSYAACNVCPESGKSPLRPSHVCKEGEYVCDCSDRSGSVPRPVECVDPAVGREDISFFGKRGIGRHCDEESESESGSGSESGIGEFLQTFMNTVRGRNRNRNLLGMTGLSKLAGKHAPVSEQVSVPVTVTRGPGAKKTTCALSNAADLLGGHWYSTLDIGLEQGTWRTVQIIKQVSKECHSDSFLSTIEKRGDPACFQACGYGNIGSGIGIGIGSDIGGMNRNISDTCYVQCFADTILGSGATNSTSPSTAGVMTKDEIEAAWSRPFDFLDPEDGGCPDISSVTL